MTKASRTAGGVLLPNLTRQEFLFTHNVEVILVLNKILISFSIANVICPPQS